jgi:hypothetical protein
MLPQIVLAKLTRGGKALRRRVDSAVRARIADYMLDLNSSPSTSQAGQHSEHLRSPSTISDPTSAVSHDSTEANNTEVSQLPAGEFSDCSTDIDSDLDQHTHTYVDSPHREEDEHVIGRAKAQIRCGLVRRAAQTLSSTAAMADFLDPRVRSNLNSMHPPLPATSVMPLLPAEAPNVVLEDAAVRSELKHLIRQSNNGAAGGPSGWAGNLLSSLSENDICRMGIGRLFNDILNNRIPDTIRPHLLACKLVGFDKKGVSGGVRPIAIGELFYRVTATYAVRKVIPAAVTLLSPHQYGVGVPGGCELIIHSLQHTLTDRSTDRRFAALRVDIRNAFNTCDRALLLRKLYDTPQLASLWRIAHFAYSTPSHLHLQGCEGEHIMSTNGVRQGDPLSSLLFCLYIRDMLTTVSQSATVDLYGLIDDLHVAGEPDEVMKAWSTLQRCLTELRLTCNTTKSHFIWFHQDERPLPDTVVKRLLDDQIGIRHNWVEVLGAVVGRDEECITAGLTEVLSSSAVASTSPFFRRLLNDKLSSQSAMMLLQNSGTAKMNYLLRCMAPTCIRDIAGEFDNAVISTALNRLNIETDDNHFGPVQLSLLRTSLRKGGWALTSAKLSSPAAFVSSLAAIHGNSSQSVFHSFTTEDTTLPAHSLLYGWLESSIHQININTSANKPSHADPPDPGPPSNNKLLPHSASSFFPFFHSGSGRSSTLFRRLSKQANSHLIDASLNAVDSKDRARYTALLRCISAPHASAWKETVPTSDHLTLSDVHYQLAARLSLGMPPHVNHLPANCTSCGAIGRMTVDPWHHLSCVRHKRTELNARHNAVVNVLARHVAWAGGVAIKEPTNLSTRDRRRPDLQIIFPGHHILTDVVVSHPLCPTHIRKAQGQHLAVARSAETYKQNKYTEAADGQRARLLSFSVETTGGVAPKARQLIEQISLACRQEHAVFSHRQLCREMEGGIAIAIQKGSAIAMMSAYSRAVMGTGVAAA